MTCGSSSIDEHLGSALGRRLPARIGARVPLALVALLLNTGCVEADVGERLPAVGAERVSDLAAGEPHRYHVNLAAGEYLHAVVEQRAIDLTVTFLDPAEKPLFQVDSPNATVGPEHLWTIAERPGRYLLELRAESGSGSYVFRTLAQGPPQGRDADFAAAAKALSEGDELRLRRERGAYHQALTRYQQALTLWQRLDEPLQEAITQTNIGRTWFALGQPEPAIQSYEAARRSLRSGPWRHSHQAVALLNWLASAHRWNLDLTAAQKAFTEAIEIAREIDDLLGEATALTNLAAVINLQGQAQDAFGLYEEALPLWQELGDRRKSSQALTNMGYHYILLGQLDEASSFLEQAEGLAREAAAGREEARALMHLGWVYYLQDGFTQALDSYSQALDLSVTLGERSIQAGVLDRQGNVYIELARLEEARACFEQALGVFEELGDKTSAAHVETNLSRVHTRLGDFERALYYFDLALGQFEGSEYLHGEASALFIGAEAERRRGDLHRARTYMERVLSIVESNRSASINQDWRTSYLESRYIYYEFYIDLLMELSVRESAPRYAEQALVVAERTRARSLLDLLSESGARIRHDVDETLLERERDLREQLNAKVFEHSRAGRDDATPEHLARISEEIAELSREEQRLRAKIRQTSPAYAALTALEPVDLRRIQRELLDGETLLLVYSLGQERSFLWAIYTDSVRSYELPKRATIEQNARRLHRYLSKSSKRGPGMQARLAAAALSDIVLKPVAGQLRRRLLIVADGALQYVPFAALPSPVSESDYLVSEHEIVYLPSASVLAALRRESQERPQARGLVAVLADPVFAAEDPRVQGSGSAAPPVHPAARSAWTAVRRSTRGLGLANLPRLPHSRREATAILALASHHENLVALDFEATRTLAKSAELGRYRFVHFATHGVLNTQHPELSGIVFSMVDEQRRAIDGFLRAHEIYDLRLSADLVVLSACQTALGREVRGEGLLGLTRGFLYAGAPRVMVSLWSVDDEATAELMERFYRGILVEQQPPAVALREAQRSMLEHERWRAPAYWAGFVLQGEWR